MKVCPITGALKLHQRSLKFASYHTECYYKYCSSTSYIQVFAEFSWRRITTW